jgi:hypothetical protein
MQCRLRLRKNGVSPELCGRLLNMVQARAKRGVIRRRSGVYVRIHEHYEPNPPNYDEFFDIDRCGLIFSAITTIVSKLTPYRTG